MTFHLHPEYAATIRGGKCVLVHPREEDVRRIIAAHPQREGSSAYRLMVWIMAVRGEYDRQAGRETLVRQGWGPMVARIARGMGVYQ